ncbi:uncharacterized protein LOC122614050 isoform X2 [Drosophila teissieri]|uniref:uncharacterized protein LOC122614050 isoform X2 n=1 Tax=Drosophila teissieri TaxID=7243 RepID=UPI001CBA5BCE|nr:uncharacterized protein LOC122614050 isoform X2 [Drosophila teissieri]
MKPKDLDFSQEEKSSDSSNESLHPTSSGFRPRSTLSSPFYQGATTFGVNKTGETATYSESTESKRRRVYAFLNQKEIMYRKYRKMVNNSEKELEKSQWSFEKPVMRTFFFSEPIPLKPVNSRRNFVFSEPTPLE